MEGTQCTGNSWHLHIKYFFVKDRVDKGKIQVHHCPTHLMLANFFTEPLFKKFRDVIMGYKTIHTLFNEDLCLKEHVRNVREKSKKTKITATPSSALTYTEIVKGIDLKEQKQQKQQYSKQSLIHIVN